MKKRIIYIAVLSVLLVACGGGNDDKASQPTPSDNNSGGNNTGGNNNSGTAAIRSSVEQSIQQTYSNQPVQKELALINARYYQKMLNNYKDSLSSAEAQGMLMADMNAIACARNKVNDAATADLVSAEVMSLTFDTTERREILQKIYQRAGSFEIEATGGVSC